MAKKTVKKKAYSVATALTARQFLIRLTGIQDQSEAVNVQRFFRDDDSSTKFMGVRMGSLFSLAKEFAGMPLGEIDSLLDSDFYEARMGAVCIMDFQARDKKIAPARKKELFELYLSRHDRINNWDMVDRSAPHVVGGYLDDKPRKILYTLARSRNVWERRTAIVSTWFFIRKNDLKDTFAIATFLVNDKHDLIQKAVGSWVREAGKRDKKMLLAFLDEFAASMPRPMLRYAIEKLDKKSKEFYLKVV